MTITAPSIRLLLSTIVLALLGCQAQVDPAWRDQGIAYLQTNASRSAVVTLPSGLQYKVLAEGNGRSPGPVDTVEVHYVARLIDNREFDSSRGRGEPAKFPVNQVIPGWTEALQLMKEGDRWELTIPPRLGYGSRGAGSSIPGDSVLIFDVELLAVQ